MWYLGEATARASGAQGAFKLPAEGINFEDVERNLITHAMEQTDTTSPAPQKLLGLTFRTLQYRLEKFGIKKPDGKDGEGEE
jgi:transcriptional regulator with GAF, ATPase, and Fis domain